MKVLVLAAVVFLGWNTFGGQVKAVAASGYAATMGWFGLDPSAYGSTAQQSGATGVVSHLGSDLQSQFNADMSAGAGTN